MTGRHLTTTITMLVLIGILVLGAVWGWRSLTADLPSNDTLTSSDCTTEELEEGQRLRARQVEVSVYNGGSQPGLADSTLSALEDRGFLAGEVGNAPEDAEVRRVEVRAETEDDLAARLVARQFGKNTEVTVADEDLGPGVDVIVGNRFRQLAKAPRRIQAEEAQEVCLPANDGS